MKKVSSENNSVHNTTCLVVVVRTLHTRGESNTSEDEIRRLQEVMDDTIVFCLKKDSKVR